jgi:putative spermidine/putrescine transport system permease protein
METTLNTAFADTTSPASAATTAAGVSLKVQLRRAERLKKIKYGALIVPLVVFLFLTFLWPIASLLKRSVDNPEVVGGLPQTSAALKSWDGKALPNDAAFQALAADLLAGKGTPPLANAAKRLNMEQPGFRSLIMGSARNLDADDPRPVREVLLEADPRWGEIATWSAIAHNASPVTAHYLLAALDHQTNAEGDIVASPADQSIYLDILGRTFWMSFVVTGCCLLLGFPLAYLLATQPTKTANLLMILVLLPFWTSILVRVAAWIVLLQSEGLINQALMLTGITSEPLQLVFNRFGVYIAMVHILLPFMILPLYSVMKGISPTYMRAAISLGCPPTKSFWKIYFPQTLPGVAAGALLVFILCMGYYITPALLGSPKEQMASYFVAFYTNETINWGMAAALSTILLAATLVLYIVYSRLVGSQGPSLKTK